ncbi:aminoglycoside phosphotransferase family protein [Thiomicrorhabdus cannonii]|uniref:aminoglycoside phosphotransferase family protein n=1 Tax=Thiomicrorhabdus cannonii TaxID=2748011 RepID=UPI0015BE39D5|nr:aminoglycoside phosphotransferase family protein [Thiomicrorhabdus cannonii]
MRILPPLYETLRFLLLDLQKQLQLLSDALENQEPGLLDKSLGRVDYIDNAHLTLLERAGRQYGRRTNEHSDAQQRIVIQSYEHIAHSLKALSGQLQQMAHQLKHIGSLKLIRKKNVFSALQDLNKGLSLITAAIESDSLTLAVDICRLQLRIDKACSAQLDKYKKRLRQGISPPQSDALLQACFILKDIDLMGDALLRVGEGIMSANLGQFIQIDRFRALEESLSVLDGIRRQDLNIHSMGETKSGCTISGVSASSESEDRILAIFKQGKKTKLQEEKARIEKWHQKYPGIAPEVYAYQKQGDKAALLYEYLTGQTFNKLLLAKQSKPLKKGLDALFATLNKIWEQTAIDEVHPAHFMKQLQRRLPQVYEVHPDFQLKGLKIGNVKQVSLETLVEEAQKFEKRLQVPKAVYIHGDFNTDNILYDPLEEQISFIDLHRSEYLDYVQDLSVLMVSFYRIANFDPTVRKRIVQAMQASYAFATEYAAKIDDRDVELRLALGLARSLITSTRFVLDKEHAKSMHFKGRLLIEQLLQLSDDELHHYKIPKELFHD